MAEPARHLADEILEEIFIRLPTPAALARASTASPRFRRIITERPFLRRIRALHPPPLLGFAVDKRAFHHAQEPHPSAPLARALADGADFSYSFVPVPQPQPNQELLSPWYHRDIRDGRVLLERSYLFGAGAAFTDLAVGDPVSRRYVLLPSIPEEMAVQQERLVEFGPMLGPAGEDGDDTSFTVISTAGYNSKLVTFVFSSVTGQWCVAASPSWSSLGTAAPTWKGISSFSYLRGRFYWGALWKDKLLVLDTRTMEFSTLNILTGYHMQLLNQPGLPYWSTIVGGTNGALEMFTPVGDYRSTSLHHTTQQNNGESSKEWKLKNVIALPPGSLYFTVGATEGFLFLRGAQLVEDSYGLLPKHNSVDFYSLDVKTSELKKVCRATTHFDHPNVVHSYFGFPPSLFKPTL
ncbi:hypothetical protein CFC21_010442 [Triticum aestivum]|uniref:F-box domain-containing protein n=2 Tax=Triticum aestivum TaxID=4565 RepID=A0A3B6UBB3_WHEAT|nr:uncharacterized protein LOC123172998 [Triticum aestivum]KAF6993566.1 hypothetical protein CFC21_010442 [Triticum aestivum]